MLRGVQLLLADADPYGDIIWVEHIPELRNVSYDGTVPASGEDDLVDVMQINRRQIQVKNHI